MVIRPLQFPFQYMQPPEPIIGCSRPIYNLSEVVLCFRSSLRPFGVLLRSGLTAYGIYGRRLLKRSLCNVQKFRPRLKGIKRTAVYGAGHAKFHTVTAGSLIVPDRTAVLKHDSGPQKNWFSGRCVPNCQIGNRYSRQSSPRSLR